MKLISGKRIDTTLMPMGNGKQMTLILALSGNVMFNYVIVVHVNSKHVILDT